MATGWEISIGDFSRLVVALFVRDTAGLQPATDPVIPPLAPAVAVRERLADAVAVDLHAQWASWWNDLLGLTGSAEGHKRLLLLPQHEFPELSDKANLLDLVSETATEAQEWAENWKLRYVDFRRQANWPFAVEQDMIRETIRRRWWRRAPSFHLRVVVIPVAASRGWQLGREHVLVTETLMTDAPGYRAWLRPVIAELARR